VIGDLWWREDATNWKPYCACGNSSAVTHARTSSSQWRPCASEDGRLPVPEAQILHAILPRILERTDSLGLPASGQP